MVRELFDNFCDGSTQVRVHVKLNTKQIITNTVIGIVKDESWEKKDDRRGMGGEGSIGRSIPSGEYNTGCFEPNRKICKTLSPFCSQSLLI